MRNIKILRNIIMMPMSLLLLAGCNLANHGSFITQTYRHEIPDNQLVKLGSVVGQSCQTNSIYLIPLGEPVSTAAAIEDAKQVLAGTILLGDLSIDDKLSIQLGYSVQCILVSATAYGQK